MFSLIPIDTLRDAEQLLSVFRRLLLSPVLSAFMLCCSVNGVGATAVPFDMLNVVYLTAPPGDFKHDGDVSAADYVVLRKTDGGSAGYNLW